MNAEPECPQSSPYVLELDAGSHAWCACGRSTQQPFCDGSHAGTDFRPTVFRLSERKKVALCGCKRTGNRPWCDGTHGRL